VAADFGAGVVGAAFGAELGFGVDGGIVAGFAEPGAGAGFVADGVMSFGAPGAGGLAAAAGADGFVPAGAGGLVPAGAVGAGWGSALAWRVGLGAGSPRNLSSSLPWMAAFMKAIQMGRAALAPVSFSPRDWRLSKPTQTPQVTEGEKPMNQASV